MSVCLFVFPSFFLFLFLSFLFLSFFRPFLLPFFLSFYFLSFIHSLFHSFFLSCFLFSLSSCKNDLQSIDIFFLSQSVCLFLYFHSFILSFVFFLSIHSFIYSFILSFVLSFIFFFPDFFLSCFFLFSLRFCWKLSTFDIGDLNWEAGYHLTVCEHVCVWGAVGG